MYFLYSQRKASVPLAFGPLVAATDAAATSLDSHRHQQPRTYCRSRRNARASPWRRRLEREATTRRMGDPTPTVAPNRPRRRLDLVIEIILTACSITASILREETMVRRCRENYNTGFFSIA